MHPSDVKRGLVKAGSVTKTIRIMIKFKKYSSIENHFYKDYLDQVMEQVPADMQWVVQEKVHGTNTSFLCDGNDVKFTKRTSILEDDEKFYDYQEILEEYRDKVMALYHRVCLVCLILSSTRIVLQMWSATLVS